MGETAKWQQNVTICCVFGLSVHKILCEKHKNLLTFCEHSIIIALYKHEQRLPHRKGSIVRCLSLTREWGKAQVKAPHWPIPCALRKMSVGESQSLGLDPEKAGQIAAWSVSRETYCVVRMLLSEWLWWCSICFGTCIITIFCFYLIRLQNWCALFEGQKNRTIQ